MGLHTTRSAGEDRQIATAEERGPAMSSLTTLLPAPGSVEKSALTTTDKLLPASGPTSSADKGCVSASGPLLVVARELGRHESVISESVV